MGSFTKREQIVILVIVFIIIFSLGFKFVIKDIIKPNDNTISLETTNDLLEDEDMEHAPEINSEDNMIMVHISGQVYKPGIVEIEPGKRLTDAVKLAGGLKKDADMDRMNLAKKLLDEEKIYIPKIGEEIDVEIGTITQLAGDSNSNESTKININTCDKGELVSLPGIGDAIADRIMEYRSNNQFKSIEDIKSVSGIGDKKFEGIKELIRIK